MSITVDIMNELYQRFVDSRQAQGHALDEIDGHVTAYRNSDRAKHTDSRGGPPLNAAPLRRRLASTRDGRCYSGVGSRDSWWRQTGGLVFRSVGWACVPASDSRQGLEFAGLGLDVSCARAHSGVCIAHGKDVVWTYNRIYH